MNSDRYSGSQNSEQLRGTEGDRTPDARGAMLSLLRTDPETVSKEQMQDLPGFGDPVELRGIEPLTSWLQTTRSPS